jgi:RNA-directed DNA polymerase
MDKTKSKSFVISKNTVWQAYQHVKANRGSCGVDKVSLKIFDMNLKDNLYKLWNRMSSGSYFPSAVKRVEIPKAGGGIRPLGIPTVEDRIAQMVVKIELEPKLESIFHNWSYGYRPNKSAHDAVGAARINCWQNNWVVDLDIKGFFDSINHDLLMKAVRKHTDCQWHILYIERWLKAPVMFPNGTLQGNSCGTPQGGVISPLLANLFLHYAFDYWMQRHSPGIQFERYADDIVCHCKTEQQAKNLLENLRQRFKVCLLELHPDKTQIVYCKDTRRKGVYSNTKFNFLGFEFRGRSTKNRRGEYYIGFNPAIAPSKAKEIRDRIRRMVGPKQYCCSLSRVANHLNQYIRGWWNYYGKFFRSELEKRVGGFINMRFAHWARRKYKSIRDSLRRAFYWLYKVRRRQPKLLAHWPADRMGRAV